MKLRIYNDSIRLRLTRSEVARVARGSTVSSTCRFPDGSALTYALTVADAPTVDARLEPGRIEVILPRAQAIQWAVGNEVSLESTARADGATTILIEKDFTCIEPRDGEDPADLYPNPKAKRRRRATP